MARTVKVLLLIAIPEVASASEGREVEPDAARLIMLALPHRTWKKLSVSPRAAVVIVMADTTRMVRYVVKVRCKGAEPTPRRTSQL